jgi:PAS domain S-box-containing protein
MATGVEKSADWMDPLLVLDRMDEGFYAVDQNWRLLHLNQKAALFWGRERSEILGRSMLELFPEFEGSPSFRAHLEALNGQLPMVFETVSTATGAPVLLRFFPVATGLSVFFKDVTDRRQLEFQLKTREDLLSLAELSAGIGVWEQNLLTSTMTATPQFFQLLGIEPISEPVPQDFVRRFRHPDDRERVTQSFREALDKGSDIFEAEYRVVRPSGEVRWIFGRGRVTRDQEGRPLRYSGVDLDITARKQQEDHLRLVIGELQHRTNNLLTVIQSLAQQTMRQSSSLEAFSTSFSSRLAGLSQSNTLLAREGWRGASLGELIRTQIAPFADAQRFILEGPEVTLSAKAVQNLGLAFHELCTNAVKYGALSTPTGKVHVHWSIEPDERLNVIWKEQGGPRVKAPTRKGFGRVVAEQVIAAALDAMVNTKFSEDGVEWLVILPADEFEFTTSTNRSF